MPTAPPSSRDSEMSNFSKLSPFDGRYWGKANDFASSMSKFSFINFRVLVELSNADAIMDEEVQEKQLLAEEEDGMEQLEAEEGLEAAQLEPDGAKHMELEPDGIKELAAEKELVSKDSVAAPMELITHSGVNLEPRWRRHDPKPPWFLIQAQEISKWACVSFIKLPLYLSKVPQVTEVPCFSKDGDVYLQFIFAVFSIDDTLEVNKVERVAYDDVKAVEYFLKQKFESQPEIVKVGKLSLCSTKYLATLDNSL
ncbi:unnamed protein product [Microthlaspi erraticum]|uniref:Uncharacterized protein n=1 Tax=Microthlaspi erraticum TaxID=1685480 RepID=A0A6D2JRK4_9BRAS|nr:unnamed protein product [Microthlaspi erraticum]